MRHYEIQEAELDGPRRFFLCKHARSLFKNFILIQKALVQKGNGKGQFIFRLIHRIFRTTGREWPAAFGGGRLEGTSSDSYRGQERTNSLIGWLQADGQLSMRKVPCPIPVLLLAHSLSPWWKSWKRGRIKVLFLLCLSLDSRSWTATIQIQGKNQGCGLFHSIMEGGGKLKGALILSLLQGLCLWSKGASLLDVQVQ